VLDLEHYAQPREMDATHQTRVSRSERNGAEPIADESDEAQDRERNCGASNPDRMGMADSREQGL